MILVVCGFSELIALIWIGWIAWNSWGEETLEAILSSSVVVIGLVLTCIVAYAKGGSSD